MGPTGRGGAVGAARHDDDRTAGSLESPQMTEVRRRISGGHDDDGRARPDDPQDHPDEQLEACRGL